MSPKHSRSLGRRGDPGHFLGSPHREPLEARDQHLRQFEQRGLNFSHIHQLAGHAPRLEPLMRFLRDVEIGSRFHDRRHLVRVHVAAAGQIRNEPLHRLGNAVLPAGLARQPAAH